MKVDFGECFLESLLLLLKVVQLVAALLFHSLPQELVQRFKCHLQVTVILLLYGKISNYTLEGRVGRIERS